MSSTDVTVTDLGEGVGAAPQLSDLWERLNKMAERAHATNSLLASSGTSDEVKDQFLAEQEADLLSIATDIRRTITALRKKDGSSGCEDDYSSDSDEEAAAAAEGDSAHRLLQSPKMKEKEKEKEKEKRGGAPMTSSRAERAQLEDLLGLLGEMQMMHKAHKEQRERTSSSLAASCSASAAAAAATAAADEKKEGVGRGAPPDNYKKGLTAQEERHQATVDAVMDSMAAHLPSDAPLSAVEMDEMAYEMASALLEDDDVRQSFISLRDGLRPWLEKNSGGCTAEDVARFEGQLRTATALAELFETEACLSVISGQCTCATSKKAVIAHFHRLMDTLNSYGEAPNGLYRQ